MEPNDTPLSPFDLTKKAPVEAMPDPSFFIPQARPDQTTQEMYADADRRDQFLSGQTRMNQNADGTYELVADESSRGELASAGKEVDMEAGSTGFGEESYNVKSIRTDFAKGIYRDSLTKSAADEASFSLDGAGDYFASIYDALKVFSDDSTPEYTALQAKLRTQDPLWDEKAQLAAVENLRRSSPDLFKHAQMVGVNPELLALNSKNKLVFDFAIHDSVQSTQQGVRMGVYNADNPHWYSNFFKPLRENVGEGLQDPGFMRDTIITTAATMGFGTAGVVGGRMALQGGRIAMAGRALTAASREAILLTGPTVGLIEGPMYRLASTTAFASLSRTPRILASRAVAMFSEGALTGYWNAGAQAKYDYDWREMIFNDNEEAFSVDQSQLLQAGAMGGFVGIGATALLRLGLDGIRVGSGQLTKAGRAHYAPRNMGANFKNFTRSLGETFDTWATTTSGQVAWGDTLSSGRGVMFGDMIDTYLRKNLDQRDFTKILVNGERLWGQFDPHTVAKMNLDMKTATITAQKFEEATGIAGEAAMRGAAGSQAAQIFGAMFDTEHLKANGLTDADVHTALDLYKVHGPSSRGSAVGAFLDQTSRDKLGTSFEGHAKNIGNLVDTLMLDRRMERSGVSFVDTLNVAETHLGRNIDFASPSDFRSMENLGRSARGMTSADQISGAMRQLMNQADGTTDTQAPAGVREALVEAMSGGKKQFYVVDGTDPNYIVRVDTETGTTTTSTRTLQVDPKTGMLMVVHDMASDPDFKPENIIHADKMRSTVNEKLKQVTELESQKYMDAQKASLAKQKADALATGTPEGKAKSIKIEALEAAMRMEKPITVDTLEKVFHMERGQAVAALVIMKALGLDDNEAGMSIASGFAGIEGFAAGASGQIDFTARTGQAAKALIRGSKASDMGTVVHEVGHYNSFVFLHSKASAERAAIGITEDMYDGMLAWAGATRDTIDLDTPEAIKAQEKIANGWSVYMQMALKGKTSANTPVTRLFHKLGDHIGDVGTAFKSQADLDKTVVMTPAAEAVFEKLLHRSADRIDDMFEQSFIKGRWHKLDAKQKAEIGEHVLGVKGWEDYKAKKDAKSTAIRKKTDPLVATAKVFTAKEAGDQLIASLKDNSSRKALSDFRKANGRNATKAEVDAVIAEAEMDLAMFKGNARILDIEDRGPRHNIEAANPTNLKTISSDTLLSLAETAKDGSLVHYVYSLGRIANNDAGGLGLKHNVVILSTSIIADELNKRVKEAAAKVEKTKAAVAAAPTPDAAVRAHLAAERGVQVDSTPAVVAAAVAKLNAERELRAGAASPATTAAAVIEILVEPLPESVPVERAMEVRAEAVAELLTAEPAPTMAMLTEGGLTEASVEAITADLAALSARVEVTTPAENVAAHNAGTTTPAGPRETRTYVTEDGVPADLTPVQQAAAAAHQNIVHAAAQAQDTSITQIATAETGTIEELVGIEVGVVPMDHMGVVIHNARLAAVAPEQVATAQATVATLTVAANTARNRVSPANAKKIEALARLVQDNPVRMGQINQILTNLGEGTTGLDEANRAFFEAQLRFTIASTALNDLTGMSDADLQTFTDVHFKLHGKTLTDAQESIIDRLTADPKNATLIAEADKIFGKGGGAKLVTYIRGRELMALANEQAAVRTSTRFLAEPTNALKLQTALETLKTDPNNRAAQTIVGINEAHQSRVRDSLGGHVVEEEAPVGKVDEFDQPNELLERQKALRTNPLSKTITAEHTLAPDWNPATAPFDINNPSPQFIAAWMMKNGSEGINGWADILKRPNTTIATAADIANEPIVFNRIVELIGLGNVGRETGDLAVKPIIIDIAFLRDVQSKFNAAYGKRQATITVPSARLMATFAHTNQMAARSGNSLYALEFMKKAMTDPKQLDNISARLGIDPAADIFTKRAAIEAWARGEKTFNGKDMDVASADKFLGQVQSFGRKAGDREDTGRTASGLKDRKTTTSTLEPNMDKAAKSDKAYDDLCQQRAIMSFLGGELHSMLLRTGDTELADYLATRKAIWGQDGDYVENFNNARALRSSSPQNPKDILTKSQLATLDLRLDERIEVLAKELDRQGHREVAGIVRDTRLGVAKGAKEVGRDIGPAEPVRIMQQISSELATQDIAKLVQKSFERAEEISIDPFLVGQLMEFPLTAGIATGKINNAAAALDSIVATGGPRASVAAKLLQLARKDLEKQAVMGTIDDTDKTMGVHFTQEGLITVNLRIHDSKIQETLLHEAVHSVTTLMLHKHFDQLDPELYESRGMDYISRLENISQMKDCPPGVKLIIDAYLQYASDQEGKLNRDGNVWMTESAKKRFGSFQDQTGEFSQMSGPEYEFDYAALNINEFLAVTLSNPRFAAHLMKQEAWLPNPDASAFGDIMEGATDLAAKFMGEDEIVVAETLMFKLYLGASQTIGTELDSAIYDRHGATKLIGPYPAPFRINPRTMKLRAINSLPKNANTKTFYQMSVSPDITAGEKAISDLGAAKGRLYKAMAEATPQKESAKPVSIAPDRGVPARTMNQFNPNDAKRVDLDVTTRKDFKRWFGKSSVTNSDGEPMQVFLEKLEDANDWRINTEDRIYGKGNYFVANPDKAHAGTVGYLSIQKPMDMDADADVEAWIAAVPDRIRGDLRWDTMSGKMRLTNEVMYTKLHKKMTADERIKMLKDMGHDGITKINRDSRGKEINRTFVVFDKNQMDMRFDYGHIRTFLGADPAGLDKGGYPLELSHNGDMVFTSSASIKGRFGKDKLSVITRLQKKDTLTVSSPMVLSDADFRSGDVDLPVNVLRTAIVTVLQKAKAPTDQIAAVKASSAEQLAMGNWKLDAKSVADAALLEGYKGVQFTAFADGRDVGDKWFIFSPTDVVPLDVTSTRTLNQKRMENDLAVRANVEGEAGKDVKAVEKRLKDLQDTVESRRRDLRSLGLHEETESRDLKHLLSIINGTPAMQEPSHMDILDRLGESVPDVEAAFRAGKAIINLRDMTDDERREFVTRKMVPTINKAMGQRITGSYSGSKLGKLSERLIGGAVDYANVANSDSTFLQFVAKIYDPTVDLRNAEIQGMLDLPTVDMANARLNNMYAKSGLMAARDKALLVCKTDAELDDANNLAWKYLANRDGLPKDVKNRELVLMTIDAANAFNKEVGELKVKHGLLKESNHLEYGTIRKASELAYNDRKGFADALHANALKKAQEAAAKQGEVSLVTAEALGWVNIRRETHGTDDITHVNIPDGSPLKAIAELPKEMEWDSKARQAFAVMLPLLSEDAQKQHAEGLVSSKGYKDIWKQATGSRGDSHTALRETMEIASNRYLGIDDLSASKSAKPRSERTMGGRMYNEERILTHNEIANDPALAKYFEQNIFGLTHDTLRGDVTDLVMTDMLTDFFGGQVRMPMIDMIEMLNKTGENFMGKHQLSTSEAKARQAGYNRVKTAWEHHTGRLVSSVDSMDSWYESLLGAARTAVMTAGGLGATLGSIPELARAIVSSDSSRSGLAQLLPNLSKVVQLYNKRTAIQECASAAHWIRLMSADNVLAKSDVMPTSPFHGLSYGGRESGYFNGWKNAWRGVAKMNAVTDGKVAKVVNALGLASKIPADMLRAVNSYTTTLHIWNAQLNLTRDSAKFLKLAEALQKTGPKDLAQFEKLAKSVGLLPQEALDLSTAGLLNPVHIKQLIEAGKDQSNYTDGMLDVRKLFVWASKQDDPKVAEEAINKMGGYIGMTARRSNTEPTLLDVRVNQSAFGRAMNVFMQFLLSHSVQEIGRRRRYNASNYSKHLVGLFLCEVAAGAMRGYKDRYMWGSDKETLDEKVSRNPLETGLSYATSLPLGGSYQWIQSAARQLMYKGYNAATGEETFKERFNVPEVMSSPMSRSLSTIGNTALDGVSQTGAALAFMRDMMK